LQGISELTNLYALRLTSTGISDLSILSQQRHITELTLIDNRELDSFNTLQEMTLHNPDTLDAIRGMQNLEELAISFGWLLIDASSLGSLSNLRYLRIYDSRTFHSEVQGMDAIGQLNNLRRLNISGNDIFFNWNFIYGLESLEVLNISNNNVIGNFSGIGRLQNLRMLHMSNVRLMSSYQISRSGGMVSIGFVDTANVDDFSDALANLINLEILSISSNEVRDISFVSGMSRLRNFYAEDNFISDISALVGLSNLEFINLRRNAVENWNVLDEMVNTIIIGR